MRCCRGKCTRTSRAASTTSSAHTDMRLRGWAGIRSRSTYTPTMIEQDCKLMVNQAKSETRRHLPLQQPKSRNAKILVPRLRAQHLKPECVCRPPRPARRRDRSHRARRRMAQHGRRDQPQRRRPRTNPRPVLQAVVSLVQRHHIPDLR